MHEEEKLEQRRKTKLDKKAQKKSQQGGRTGDKRKAEHAGDRQAWDEDAGEEDGLSMIYYIPVSLAFACVINVLKICSGYR